MSDSEANLELEEQKVIAFLAPLAEVAPARRPQRIRSPRLRTRRWMIAIAVAGVIGGGGALAATTLDWQSQQEITVTYPNGGTQKSTLCPLHEYEEDFNGIKGIQPGEPCPRQVTREEWELLPPDKQS